VQKDFLHETTLQMGHSSHPCFIDYNADGLKDLLVGMNYIVSNADAISISLYLYENIGTKDQPSFKLVDNDYLGLSSDLSIFNGFLAPTAGDLDGDGDDDILIADNRSNLFYYENKGGEGMPVSFDNYIYEYKGIRVGTNGKPAIIDLDGDGLNDIVMGEKNDNGNPSTDEKGGLNFFKNIGSIGNPDFGDEEKDFPNTDILGQVYTRTIFDVSGGTSPYFFRSEGKLMLAAGSRGGNIYVYDDIPDNIYGAFNQVYDNLPILRVGRRTSVILDDIDNDGFHEMIVGNDNGGLMAFNTTFKIDKPLSTQEEHKYEFVISPNPVIDVLSIRFDINGIKQLVITNIDGRLIMEKRINSLQAEIEVSNLPNGIYLLSVESEGKMNVKKFIKF
jgi:hypothetical protein